MGFADHYLEKQVDFKTYLDTLPVKDLQFCIVIPCFNEEKLLSTLSSLWYCMLPQKPVEIIVVINSAQNSHEEIKRQNLVTREEVEDWIAEYTTPELQCHIIYKSDIEPKFAGAGYARKLGMDEAAYRFNSTRNPNGIIVSLDADTLCEPNYLVSLEKHYNEHPSTTGTTTYFEHSLDEAEFTPEIIRGITLYELYLRFYRQALRYIQYPYAFHTIGSCFSVRAEIYAQQGGMNKRRAGEDFYFLKKIFPLGNFFEINDTKVYPSPRPSNRVAFGTGPSIFKMIHSNNYDLLTYGLEGFEDIKQLISLVPCFYQINSTQLDKQLSELSVHMQSFLKRKEFTEKLGEINANCSSKEAFIKRFYYWFDNFMIIKYLNYVYPDRYKKKHVEESACELLIKISGQELAKDVTVRELLLAYRKVAKGMTY